MLFSPQYATPWWTPDGERKCRERIARKRWSNRSWVSRVGRHIYPGDGAETREQALHWTLRQANHDIKVGNPRLHPRNKKEEHRMKSMVMKDVVNALPGERLAVVQPEELRDLLLQIEQGIVAAHEKFLAHQRKAQARRLWKKAACAAWMLVEFRASVERSVAPGGAAAKRVREHFEECAKLQR